MISEPFCESVPQLHILLVLWVLNTKIIYELSPGLFIASFSTSVLSATLGIARFLKIGPCRLVPYHGPLDGHGNLSFLILVLNIASTIVSKGILLPAIGYGIFYVGQFEPQYKNLFNKIWLWLAICYLPQLIYVSINVSFNTF